MRRTRSALALALIFVTLAGIGACATTGVGKAVEAADIQKQLVELAAVEFAKAHLCAGLKTPPPSCQGRPVLTDATYRHGRDVYQKWYNSQLALSSAIATWKVVKSADNEAKLQALLGQVRVDMDAYLKLVGDYIDLKAIQKKVGA